MKQNIKQIINKILTKKENIDKKREIEYLN